MNHIKIKYYKTKFGELILGSYNESLCLCDWKYRAKREQIDRRIKKYFKADFIEDDSEVIKETISQLDEYFNYKRKIFTIPLIFSGTEFQNKVWESLLKIPFGKTSSYIKQAELLNSVKAVRAVANANGANSISIIVPCHRIIGSDGSLTGYAGGLNTKKKLLELEQDLFIETIR